jgi:SAM-dependent methyltransferase
LKLMSVCPITDLELESILVNLRSALLSSVDEISISPAILCFQSALALQCFTNEYIYNQTDRETELLEAIENAIEKTLSTGQQPSPYSILCLASYKALHEYEWCDALTINTDIEEVFVRQNIEPKEEGRLKANILMLQEITDNVSSKVREQYEANPYPRWVNLRLCLSAAPLSKVSKELKVKLFDNTINEVEAPNILIAGCGTGQHSIETASRFKDCDVLAVDLSLSSLAYAKRKTKELGLQNIDYMHADILGLGELDKKFDIIESVGVLHHMDDPMAGWRVLTDCLKSGGLMRIGLYSELARQDIARIREEIHQTNIGSRNYALKLFRNDMINSDKAHHKLIIQSGDFYSLSTLRDLLFHVQEHRFTIPLIKNSLSQLGLKLCGFESDKIVKNFKLTNTGTDDPYDLDKWDAYEKANPHVFAGMYQFWCQMVT